MKGGGLSQHWHGDVFEFGSRAHLKQAHCRGAEAEVAVSESGGQEALPEYYLFTTVPAARLLHTEDKTLRSRCYKNVAFISLFLLCAFIC
jgi:hypothetical protein